jgi:cyclophilin family peptidyl-prolyl cis-trans isomerase
MKRLVIVLIVALLMAFVANTTANSQSSAPATKKKLTKEQLADSLAAMRHEIRDSSNTIVALETDFGKMVVELYRDVAPAHADSFLARCDDGFYDGMKFHRIIKDFMIQCGNPFLVGKKPVGYYLPNELNHLGHKFGTMSMASRGSPTTAQTQFFICMDRNRKTEALDGRYVVFGQLLRGYNVLWDIGHVPVQKSQAMRGEESEPIEELFLVKAYRSDAEGNELE